MAGGFGRFREEYEKEKKTLNETGDECQYKMPDKLLTIYSETNFISKAKAVKNSVVDELVIIE